MAIYTPIVNALSELGADDIGKVVGKVGSVGGRILLHQISKHTGIDLSDPDNKQNVEEAAKRLLDDRKGFRELKVKLAEIQQSIELKEIESDQLLMSKKLALHEEAMRSDDRWVRRVRPTALRAALVFAFFLVFTFIAVVWFEVRFQSHWFAKCMEATEGRDNCFAYLTGRISFVAMYTNAMSTLGMTALIGLVLSPIAYYFHSRKNEKLEDKDDTNIGLAGVVRKVLPPYRKTQPEEQAEPVERRERVLPRKMPEGAYKRTDDEPIPPVEGIKKLMPDEPPLPPVRR